MKKIVLGTLICSVAAFAAVNLGACKGCHGQKWEKKALGTSKVVAEMTKAEVTAALKGYKAGTYGGKQKGLMKAQVAKYTDADLAGTGIGK